MRRLRTLLVCAAVPALVAAMFASPAVADGRARAKPGEQPQRLVVTVLPSITFDQDVYTVATPGRVRIVLQGAGGHAITLVERPRLNLSTPGPAHSAVVKLPRGTYHLESQIPAHTAAGIHALIVVG